MICTLQTYPSLSLFPLSSLLTFRFSKPRPHGPYHPPKPIHIQYAQNRITRQVRQRQPSWHWQLRGCLHRAPDITVQIDTLVRPPQQPAAGERGEQNDPIDELRPRARHPHLIQKPVYIEERRRQLVQHEVQAVVVDEGALHRNCQ